MTNETTWRRDMTAEFLLAYANKMPDVAVLFPFSVIEFASMAYDVPVEDVVGIAKTIEEVRAL